MAALCPSPHTPSQSRKRSRQSTSTRRKIRVATFAFADPSQASIGPCSFSVDGPSDLPKSAENAAETEIHLMEDVATDDATPSPPQTNLFSPESLVQEQLQPEPKPEPEPELKFRNLPAPVVIHGYSVMQKRGFFKRCRRRYIEYQPSVNCIFYWTAADGRLQGRGKCFKNVINGFMLPPSNAKFSSSKKMKYFTVRVCYELGKKQVDLRFPILATAQKWADILTRKPAKPALMSHAETTIVSTSSVNTPTATPHRTSSTPTLAFANGDWSPFKYSEQRESYPSRFQGGDTPPLPSSTPSSGTQTPTTGQSTSTDDASDSNRAAVPVTNVKRSNSDVTGMSVPDKAEAIRGLFATEFKRLRSKDDLKHDRKHGRYASTGLSMTFSTYNKSHRENSMSFPPLPEL